LYFSWAGVTVFLKYEEMNALTGNKKMELHTEEMKKGFKVLNINNVLRMN
jgi:hypothetical protein